MIISFKNNNGGGGSGQDTQLRGVAFTDSAFDSSTKAISFKNMAGTAVDSIDLSSLVGSSAVHTIWKGTQAAYDNLESYDANTLYLIEEE